MTSSSYWILVVEDDPTHATLAKAVFSRRQAYVHIHVTRSAEEAIAYLKGPWHGKDLGREFPDIIALDVQMEGIGALALLKWYSRQQEIPDVPVVVFTVSEDANLERQCLELGAKEFKVKPTDFTELVDVVHRVLDRYKPGHGPTPAG